MDLVVAPAQICAQRPFSVVEYVEQSVPVITPRTLALARVTFGSCILYFWLVAMGPGSLEAVAANGPQHHFLKLLDRTGLLTAASADAALRSLIYWSIAGLLAAFIAGVMTCIVYPAFVCLFWLASFLNNGGHSVTPLLLALVVTLPAPWGEDWSVDAVVRRRKSQMIASPLYGYPIWLLGLTIGITYTTAGLSKLIVTEGRWLWETGARNGFMQDFGIAATDWGMFLTNNYALALGASIIAAFGQGIYVYSCFTRRMLIKYAIAFGIAIPFVVGLVLFMGHFWWPWVILILMLYLPWSAIDRFARRGRITPPSASLSERWSQHRRWFLRATGFLIALHAFAVLTRHEYEPLYSNYNMYAQAMPAGSAEEAKFWANYKSADRHYQHTIQLTGVSTDGSPISQEVGALYQLAWSLYRFRLWTLDIARLRPSVVLESARAGEPIPPEVCSTLHSVAFAYWKGNGAAHTISLGRRYIDIVNGQMTWKPVTSRVEVDLARSECPYLQVRDMPQ